MEHYLPLARKYRPAQFVDLAGQNVLVKTLSNAIYSSKIPQGIILSGIRGIGKTTSARIIAKTINCSDTKDIGGIIVSCDKCTSCNSIAKNNHPDIVEIDAASATGVDDVRQIIDSAEYKPLIGKFKVYIIDEVHMFSKNAFNALLKILEEPPSQVVFILATTEINKIPPTILSRCQKFALRRLSSEEIYGILKRISEKENISFESTALELISLKADGSARDALSLLDQASALSASSDKAIISIDLINSMVGAVDLGDIVDFVEAIFNKNADDALSILQSIYLKSSDLVYFIDNVIDVIGYLVKLKTISNYTSPLYAAYYVRLNKMISNVDLRYLSVIWQIFSKNIGLVKTSHNQILSTEMLCISAIYASSLPSPQEVIETSMRSPRPGLDNTTILKPAIDNSPNSIKSPKKIADLLLYLRSNKEFEVYYYLLNNVEILEVSDPIIKISSVGSDSKLNKQLVGVLFGWTGNRWNVIIEDKDSPVSLKDSIKSNFLTSSSWKEIKEVFPTSEILDVVLKGE